MLLGCGVFEENDFKQKPNKDFDWVSSPELNNYLIKFSKYYKVQTSHIATEFTILKDDVVGYCWWFDDGSRKIEIDSNFWIKASDDEKEDLVWHELGHCALNLKHDSNLIDIGNYNQIPKSIMNPYVFGQMPYYSDYKIYYFDELKTKGD
jgi:hypothetical protein